MELTEKRRIHLPKRVHWQKEEIHLFLDPESPHWIAADAKGARLIAWMEEGLTVGDLIRRYSQEFSFSIAKGWLHVHDFVQSLLRAGFASPEPIVPAPYQGRALYAQPTRLKELWFHTNNICNLSCTHCLVSSAPWVKDWGLPTDRVLSLVDEAVELGVDRFYMTGGEPFMRKDLVQIIRTITESKKAELIILTNATLFKGERAEALHALNRDRLRFQVSLDGASAAANDRIRGHGSFQATLDGLRLLVELGFPVSLTTVVTGSSLKELPEITRLAHRLGVTTQHLMWPHRRGRILESEGASLEFPKIEELIEALRQVRAEAKQLGVHLDNWESIKQRVNSRPGVKYDLGNACWDSLCIWSDGTVYPSAALANLQPLALGVVPGTTSKKVPGAIYGTLRNLWQRSPVADAFRNASVVQMRHLAGDPFRFLTGGGDMEHSFCFTGDLTGPDPYYHLYTAMMEDAMWELARAKQELLNLRSGYDVPRILHAMGDGAIHCATDDLEITSGAASSSRSHDLAVTGEIDVRTLHSNCVLAFDVDKPRKLVREFYGKAAETPQAELCCPTKFDPAMVGHIPKEVVDRFYGCGSPVTMGNLQPGETFVDLGSGAGIDCFIAAKLVGPAGKVIGIDMTDEMLQVANENRPIVAANLGYDMVEFRKGFLEAVPVESKSVDLVTSNCVINLSPDKPKVFAEIWRILKDNGRMVIADIVSDRQVPARLKVNPQLWGECTVGALTEAEFLAQLEEAGFYGLAVLKKSAWKSIPARPEDFQEAGGEGFDFYSVTVQGFKFEKAAGCRFIGQRAIYLGPMKSVIDEEGHLFPRNVAVEVCTDTAAKLSNPPYAGHFLVIASTEGAKQSRFEITSGPLATLGVPRNDATTAACGPGCC